MKPSNLKSITYTGPSMNPILRAGDGLQIVPYNGKKIRTGDVIVFNSPDEDRKITHRVISVDSKGIRTRGDNNKNVDPWVLTPDNIIGRVVYAQRGNRRKKVFGGSAGRLFLVARKSTRALKSLMVSQLRPVYLWMVRTGIFRRCLQSCIRSRFISLNRPKGIELQLLIGKQMIGRLLPEKGEWEIRRPFRLFLDETSLPKGLESGSEEKSSVRSEPFGSPA